MRFLVRQRCLMCSVAAYSTGLCVSHSPSSFPASHRELEYDIQNCSKILASHPLRTRSLSFHFFERFRLFSAIVFPSSRRSKRCFLPEPVSQTCKAALHVRLCAHCDTELCCGPGFLLQRIPTQRFNKPFYGHRYFGNSMTNYSGRNFLPKSGHAKYPKQPTRNGRLGTLRKFVLSPSNFRLFRISRLVLCLLRYLLGFFLGIQGFTDIDGIRFMNIRIFTFFLISVRIPHYPQDATRH